MIIYKSKECVWPVFISPLSWKPWPYMESGEARNRCNQTEWRLMRTGSTDLIWKVEVREIRARRCREHGGLTGTVSVETWQEKFHRSGNVTKRSHWEPEEETDFKFQLTGQSESRYCYRYDTLHTLTAYAGLKLQ